MKGKIKFTKVFLSLLFVAASLFGMAACSSWPWGSDDTPASDPNVDSQGRLRVSATTVNYNRPASSDGSVNAASGSFDWNLLYYFDNMRSDVPGEVTNRDASLDSSSYGFRFFAINTFLGKSAEEIKNAELDSSLVANLTWKTVNGVTGWFNNSGEQFFSYEQIRFADLFGSAASQGSIVSAISTVNRPQYAYYNVLISGGTTTEVQVLVNYDNLVFDYSNHYQAFGVKNGLTLEDVFTIKYTVQNGNKTEWVTLDKNNKTSYRAFEIVDDNGKLIIRYNPMLSAGSTTRNIRVQALSHTIDETESNRGNANYSSPVNFNVYMLKFNAYSINSSEKTYNTLTYDKTKYYFSSAILDTKADAVKQVYNQASAVYDSANAYDALSGYFVEGRIVEVYRHADKLGDYAFSNWTVNGKAENSYVSGNYLPAISENNDSKILYPFTNGSCISSYASQTIGIREVSFYDSTNAFSGNLNINNKQYIEEISDGKIKKNDRYTTAEQEFDTYTGKLSVVSCNYTASNSFYANIAKVRNYIVSGTTFDAELYFSGNNPVLDNVDIYIYWRGHDEPIARVMLGNFVPNETLLEEYNQATGCNLNIASIENSSDGEFAIRNLSYDCYVTFGKSTIDGNYYSFYSAAMTKLDDSENASNILGLLKDSRTYSDRTGNSIIGTAYETESKVHVNLFVNKNQSSNATTIEDISGDKIPYQVISTTTQETDVFGYTYSKVIISLLLPSNYSLTAYNVESVKSIGEIVYNNTATNDGLNYILQEISYDENDRSTVSTYYEVNVTKDISVTANGTLSYLYYNDTAYEYSHRSNENMGTSENPYMVNTYYYKAISGTKSVIQRIEDAGINTYNLFSYTELDGEALTTKSDSAEDQNSGKIKVDFTIVYNDKEYAYAKSTLTNIDVVAKAYPIGVDYIGKNGESNIIVPIYAYYGVSTWIDTAHKEHYFLKTPIGSRVVTVDENDTISVADDWYHDELNFTELVKDKVNYNFNEVKKEDPTVAEENWVSTGEFSAVSTESGEEVIFAALGEAILANQNKYKAFLNAIGGTSHIINNCYYFVKELGTPSNLLVSQYINTDAGKIVDSQQAYVEYKEDADGKYVYDSTLNRYVEHTTKNDAHYTKVDDNHYELSLSGTYLVLAGSVTTDPNRGNAHFHLLDDNTTYVYDADPSTWVANQSKYMAVEYAEDTNLANSFVASDDTENCSYTKTTTAKTANARYIIEFVEDPYAGYTTHYSYDQDRGTTDAERYYEDENGIFVRDNTTQQFTEHTYINAKHYALSGTTYTPGTMSANAKYIISSITADQNSTKDHFKIESGKYVLANDTLASNTKYYVVEDYQEDTNYNKGHYNVTRNENGSYVYGEYNPESSYMLEFVIDNYANKQHYKRDVIDGTDGTKTVESKVLGYKYGLNGLTMTTSSSSKGIIEQTNFIYNASTRRYNPEGTNNTYTLSTKNADTFALYTTTSTTTYSKVADPSEKTRAFFSQEENNTILENVSIIEQGSSKGIKYQGIQYNDNLFVTCVYYISTNVVNLTGKIVPETFVIYRAGTKLYLSTGERMTVTTEVDGKEQITFYPAVTELNKDGSGNFYITYGSYNIAIVDSSFKLIETTTVNGKQVTNYCNRKYYRLADTESTEAVSSELNGELFPALLDDNGNVAFVMCNANFAYISTEYEYYYMDGSTKVTAYPESVETEIFSSSDTIVRRAQLITKNDSGIETLRDVNLLGKRVLLADGNLEKYPRYNFFAPAETDLKSFNSTQSNLATSEGETDAETETEHTSQTIINDLALYYSVDYTTVDAVIQAFPGVSLLAGAPYTNPVLYFEVKHKALEQAVLNVGLNIVDSYYVEVISNAISSTTKTLIYDFATVSFKDTITNLTTNDYIDRMHYIVFANSLESVIGYTISGDNQIVPYLSGTPLTIQNIGLNDNDNYVYTNDLVGDNGNYLTKLYYKVTDGSQKTDDVVIGSTRLRLLTTDNLVIWQSSANELNNIPTFDVHSFTTLENGLVVLSSSGDENMPCNKVEEIFISGTGATTDEYDYSEVLIGGTTSAYRTKASALENLVFKDDAISSDRLQSYWWEDAISIGNAFNSTNAYFFCGKEGVVLVANPVVSIPDSENENIIYRFKRWAIYTRYNSEVLYYNAALSYNHADRNNPVMRFVSEQAGYFVFMPIYERVYTLNIGTAIDEGAANLGGSVNIIYDNNSGASVNIDNSRYNNYARSEDESEQNALDIYLTRFLPIVNSTTNKQEYPYSNLSIEPVLYFTGEFYNKEVASGQTVDYPVFAKRDEVIKLNYNGENHYFYTEVKNGHTIMKEYNVLSGNYVAGMPAIVELSHSNGQYLIPYRNTKNEYIGKWAVQFFSKLYTNISGEETLISDLFNYTYTVDYSSTNSTTGAETVSTFVAVYNEDDKYFYACDFISVLQDAFNKYMEAHGRLIAKVVDVDLSELGLISTTTTKGISLISIDKGVKFAESQVDKYNHIVMWNKDTLAFKDSLTGANYVYSSLGTLRAGELYSYIDEEGNEIVNKTQQFKTSYFDRDTNIILSATADSGYRLEGWYLAYYNKKTGQWLVSEDKLSDTINFAYSNEIKQVTYIAEENGTGYWYNITNYKDDYGRYYEDSAKSIRAYYQGGTDTNGNIVNNDAITGLYYDASYGTDGYRPYGYSANHIWMPLYQRNGINYTDSTYSSVYTGTAPAVRVSHYDAIRGISNGISTSYYIGSIEIYRVEKSGEAHFYRTMSDANMTFEDNNLYIKNLHSDLRIVAKFIESYTSLIFTEDASDDNLQVVSVYYSQVTDEATGKVTGARTTPAGEVYEDIDVDCINYKDFIITSITPDESGTIPAAKYLSDYDTYYKNNYYIIADSFGKSNNNYIGLLSSGQKIVNKQIAGESTDEQGNMLPASPEELNLRNMYFDVDTNVYVVLRVHFDKKLTIHSLGLNTAHTLIPVMQPTDQFISNNSAAEPSVRHEYLYYIFKVTFDRDLSIYEKDSQAVNIVKKDDYGNEKTQSSVIPLTDYSTISSNANPEYLVHENRGKAIVADVYAGKYSSYYHNLFKLYDQNGKEITYTVNSTTKKVTLSSAYREELSVILNISRDNTLISASYDSLYDLFKAIKKQYEYQVEVLTVKTLSGKECKTEADVIEAINAQFNADVDATRRPNGRTNIIESGATNFINLSSIPVYTFTTSIQVISEATLNGTTTEVIYDEDETKALKDANVKLANNLYTRGGYQGQYTYIGIADEVGFDSAVKIQGQSFAHKFDGGEDFSIFAEDYILAQDTIMVLGGLTGLTAASTTTSGNATYGTIYYKEVDGVYYIFKGWYEQKKINSALADSEKSGYEWANMQLMSTQIETPYESSAYADTNIVALFERAVTLNFKFTTDAVTLNFNSIYDSLNRPLTYSNEDGVTTISGVFGVTNNIAIDITPSGGYRLTNNWSAKNANASASEDPVSLLTLVKFNQGNETESQNINLVATETASVLVGSIYDVTKSNDTKPTSIDVYIGVKPVVLTYIVVEGYLTKQDTKYVVTGPEFAMFYDNGGTLERILQTIYDENTNTLNQLAITKKDDAQRKITLELEDTTLKIYGYFDTDKTDKMYVAYTGATAEDDMLAWYVNTHVEYTNQMDSRLAVTLKTLTDPYGEDVVYELTKISYYYKMTEEARDGQLINTSNLYLQDRDPISGTYDVNTTYRVEEDDYHDIYDVQSTIDNYNSMFLLGEDIVSYTLRAKIQRTTTLSVGYQTVESITGSDFKQISSKLIDKTDKGTISYTGKRTLTITRNYLDLGGNKIEVTVDGNKVKYISGTLPSGYYTDADNYICFNSKSYLTTGNTNLSNATYTVTISGETLYVKTYDGFLQYVSGNIPANYYKEEGTNLLYTGDHNYVSSSAFTLTYSEADANVAGNIIRVGVNSSNQLLYISGTLPSGYYVEADNTIYTNVKNFQNATEVYSEDTPSENNNGSEIFVGTALNSFLFSSSTRSTLSTSMEYYDDGTNLYKFIGWYEAVNGVLTLKSNTITLDVIGGGTYIAIYAKTQKLGDVKTITLDKDGNEIANSDNKNANITITSGTTQKLDGKNDKLVTIDVFGEYNGEGYAVVGSTIVASISADNGYLVKNAYVTDSVIASSRTYKNNLALNYTNSASDLSVATARVNVENKEINIVAEIVSGVQLNIRRIYYNSTAATGTGISVNSSVYPLSISVNGNEQTSANEIFTILSGSTVKITGKNSAVFGLVGFYINGVAQPIIVGEDGIVYAEFIFNENATLEVRITGFVEASVSATLDAAPNTSITTNITYTDHYTGETKTGSSVKVLSGTILTLNTSKSAGSSNSFQNWTLSTEVVATKETFNVQPIVDSMYAENSTVVKSFAYVANYNSARLVTISKNIPTNANLNPQDRTYYTEEQMKSLLDVEIVYTDPLGTIQRVTLGTADSQEFYIKSGTNITLNSKLADAVKDRYYQSSTYAYGENGRYGDLIAVENNVVSGIKDVKIVVTYYAKRTVTISRTVNGSASNNEILNVNLRKNGESNLLNDAYSRKVDAYIGMQRLEVIASLDSEYQFAGFYVNGTFAGTGETENENYQKIQIVQPTTGHEEGTHDGAYYYTDATDLDIVCAWFARAYVTTYVELDGKYIDSYSSSVYDTLKNKLVVTHYGNRLTGFDAADTPSGQEFAGNYNYNLQSYTTTSGKTELYMANRNLSLIASAQAGYQFIGFYYGEEGTKYEDLVKVEFKNQDEFMNSYSRGDSFINLVLGEDLVQGKRYIVVAKYLTGYTITPAYNIFNTDTNTILSEYSAEKGWTMPSVKDAFSLPIEGEYAANAQGKEKIFMYQAYNDGTKIADNNNDLLAVTKADRNVQYFYPYYADSLSANFVVVQFPYNDSEYSIETSYFYINGQKVAPVGSVNIQSNKVYATFNIKPFIQKDANGLYSFNNLVITAEYHKLVDFIVRIGVDNTNDINMVNKNTLENVKIIISVNGKDQITYSNSGENTYWNEDNKSLYILRRIPVGSLVSANITIGDPENVEIYKKDDAGTLLGTTYYYNGWYMYANQSIAGSNTIVNYTKDCQLYISNNTDIVAQFYTTKLPYTTDQTYAFMFTGEKFDGTKKYESTITTDADNDLNREINAKLYEAFSNLAYNIKFDNYTEEQLAENYTIKVVTDNIDPTTGDVVKIYITPVKNSNNLLFKVYYNSSSNYKYYLFTGWYQEIKSSADSRYLFITNNFGLNYAGTPRPTQMQSAINLCAKFVQIVEVYLSQQTNDSTQGITNNNLSNSIQMDTLTINYPMFISKDATNIINNSGAEIKPFEVKLDEYGSLRMNVLYGSQAYYALKIVSGYTYNGSDVDKGYSTGKWIVKNGDTYARQNRMFDKTMTISMLSQLTSDSNLMRLYNYTYVVSTSSENEDEVIKLVDKNSMSAATSSSANISRANSRVASFASAEDVSYNRTATLAASADKPDDKSISFVQAEENTKTLVNATFNLISEASSSNAKVIVTIISPDGNTNVYTLDNSTRTYSFTGLTLNTLITVAADTSSCTYEVLSTQTLTFSESERKVSYPTSASSFNYLVVKSDDGETLTFDIEFKNMFSLSLKDNDLNLGAVNISFDSDNVTYTSIIESGMSIAIDDIIIEFDADQSISTTLLSVLTLGISDEEIDNLTDAINYLINHSTARGAYGNWTISLNDEKLVITYSVSSVTYVKMTLDPGYTSLADELQYQVLNYLNINWSIIANVKISTMYQHYTTAKAFVTTEDFETYADKNNPAATIETNHEYVTVYLLNRWFTEEYNGKYKFVNRLNKVFASYCNNTDYEFDGYRYAGDRLAEDSSSADTHISPNTLNDYITIQAFFVERITIGFTGDLIEFYHDENGRNLRTDKSFITLYDNGTAKQLYEDDLPIDEGVPSGVHISFKLNSSVNVTASDTQNYWSFVTWTVQYDYNYVLDSDGNKYTIDTNSILLDNNFLISLVSDLSKLNVAGNNKVDLKKITICAQLKEEYVELSINYSVPGENFEISTSEGYELVPTQEDYEYFTYGTNYIPMVATNYQNKLSVVYSKNYANQVNNLYIRASEYKTGTASNATARRDLLLEGTSAAVRQYVEKDAIASNTYSASDFLKFVGYMDTTGTIFAGTLGDSTHPINDVTFGVVNHSTEYTLVNKNLYLIETVRAADINGSTGSSVKITDITNSIDIPENLDRYGLNSADPVNYGVQSYLVEEGTQLKVEFINAGAFANKFKQVAISHDLMISDIIYRFVEAEDTDPNAALYNDTTYQYNKTDDMLSAILLEAWLGAMGVHNEDTVNSYYKTLRQYSDYNINDNVTEYSFTANKNTSFIADYLGLFTTQKQYITVLLGADNTTKYERADDKYTSFTGENFIIVFAPDKSKIKFNLTEEFDRNDTIYATRTSNNIPGLSVKEKSIVVTIIDSDDNSINISVESVIAENGQEYLHVDSSSTSLLPIKSEIGTFSVNSNGYLNYTDSKQQTYPVTTRTTLQGVNIVATYTVKISKSEDEQLEFDTILGKNNRLIVSNTSIEEDLPEHFFIDTDGYLYYGSRIDYSIAKFSDGVSHYCINSSNPITAQTLLDINVYFDKDNNIEITQNKSQLALGIINDKVVEAHISTAYKYMTANNTDFLAKLLTEHFNTIADITNVDSQTFINGYLIDNKDAYIAISNGSLLAEADLNTYIKTEKGTQNLMLLAEQKAGYHFYGFIIISQNDAFLLDGTSSLTKAVQNVKNSYVLYNGKVVKETVLPYTNQTSLKTIGEKSYYWAPYITLDGNAEILAIYQPKVSILNVIKKTFDPSKVEISDGKFIPNVAEDASTSLGRIKSNTGSLQFDSTTSIFELIIASNGFAEYKGVAMEAKTNAQTITALYSHSGLIANYAEESFIKALNLIRSSTNTETVLSEFEIGGVKKFANLAKDKDGNNISSGATYGAVQSSILFTDDYSVFDSNGMFKNNTASTSSLYLHFPESGASDDLEIFLYFVPISYTIEIELSEIDSARNYASNDSNSSGNSDTSAQHFYVYKEALTNSNWKNPTAIEEITEEYADKLGIKDHSTYTLNMTVGEYFGIAEDDPYLYTWIDNNNSSLAYPVKVNTGTVIISNNADENVKLIKGNIGYETTNNNSVNGNIDLENTIAGDKVSCTAVTDEYSINTLSSIYNYFTRPSATSNEYKLVDNLFTVKINNNTVDSGSISSEKVDTLSSGALRIGHSINLANIYAVINTNKNTISIQINVTADMNSGLPTVYLSNMGGIILDGVIKQSKLLYLNTQTDTDGSWTIEDKDNYTNYTSYVVQTSGSNSTRIKFGNNKDVTVEKELSAKFFTNAFVLDTETNTRVLDNKAYPSLAIKFGFKYEIDSKIMNPMLTIDGEDSKSFNLANSTEDNYSEYAKLVNDYFSEKLVKGGGNGHGDHPVTRYGYMSFIDSYDLYVINNATTYITILQNQAKAQSKNGVIHTVTNQMLHDMIQAILAFNPASNLDYSTSEDRGKLTSSIKEGSTDNTNPINNTEKRRKEYLNNIPQSGSIFDYVEFSKEDFVKVMTTLGYPDLAKRVEDGLDLNFRRIDIWSNYLKAFNSIPTRKYLREDNSTVSVKTNGVGIINHNYFGNSVSYNDAVVSCVKYTEHIYPHNVKTGLFGVALTGTTPGYLYVNRATADWGYLMSADYNGELAASTHYDNDYMQSMEDVVERKESSSFNSLVHYLGGISNRATKYLGTYTLVSHAGICATSEEFERNRINEFDSIITVKLDKKTVVKTANMDKAHNCWLQIILNPITAPFDTIRQLVTSCIDGDWGMFGSSLLNSWLSSMPIVNGIMTIQGMVDSDPSANPITQYLSRVDYSID